MFEWIKDNALRVIGALAPLIGGAGGTWAWWSHRVKQEQSALDQIGDRLTQHEKDCAVSWERLSDALERLKDSQNNLAISIAKLEGVIRTLLARE